MKAANNGNDINIDQLYTLFSVYTPMFKATYVKNIPIKFSEMSCIPLSCILHWRTALWRYTVTILLYIFLSRYHQENSDLHLLHCKLWYFVKLVVLCCYSTVQIKSKKLISVSNKRSERGVFITHLIISWGIFFRNIHNYMFQHL